MRVALFDIDGTILLAHGAGRRAMERALADTTGTSGPPGLHYAGKTDGQIVREAMRASGFSDAEVDAQMATILERYVTNLDAELVAPDHGPVRLLPGVGDLLLACEAHEQVLLGLLTGNLVAGAARKLRAVGVDPARFAFGAYGSDHEHRPTLAAIAHARAGAAAGRPLDAAACVVIGDTPADVACALAIGARAVAVATGNFAA
ncbi:MAG TPA: haloacid dehalogenase-like hydrolase, partial [Gemmatimonadaceae bacterium]|nr:haloacid dehalogenase-like hydrolase [Gemmatimonadaceae bacterium]